MSNYLGETSLMQAAVYGNTETVKILLEHGADINTKNQEGKLHTNTSIIKCYGVMLLEDINRPTNNVLY